MGASVLRVESLQLTLGRMLPPVVNGQSLYFWSLHRNKQRIGLNLKHVDGTNIIYKIVKDYDVVLENFRPGVMDRLGLGYDKLKEINPRLIYCSISGYGQTGSCSQKPGHDLNFLAEAGIIELNGRENEKPTLPPVLVSDYMSGMYASLQIVAQLYACQTTGKAAYIDISMFESALSTMAILGTSKLYEQAHPEITPYTYPRELPNYNVYECKDKRYLAVASLEPQFWQIFCEKIGCPEQARKLPNQHDQELKKILEDAIKMKDLSEWRLIFEDSNCCVSPVNTVLEALSSAAALERNVVHQMRHPSLGVVPQVACPLSDPIAESTAFDDTKNQTIEVLRKSGYEDADIERLRSEKVIH